MHRRKLRDARLGDDVGDAWWLSGEDKRVGGGGAFDGPTIDEALPRS
jgi:hypothetical protein